MTQLITYQPDMTAGALKVPESRIIADLLLLKSDWKEAIVRQNVLQAKTVASAVRLSNLIRARLQPMGEELLKLIRDGKGLVATHAVFVATLKHSRLFFDFLSLVVADHHRLHARELSKNVWGKFLEQCRERDPLMPVWSEETTRRLRSSIFQCLAEAGYIESTKNPSLQTVHIAAPVLEYLERHQEKAIIKAMAVHA